MIAVARLDPVLHPRRPHALALSVALHLCLMAAWMLAPSPVPRDLGAGTLQVQLVTEPPPPEPPLPEPQPQKPQPQKPQPEPAKPHPQSQPVAKAAATPKPPAAKPVPVLTASTETAAPQEVAPAAEAPPAAAPPAAAPTAAAPAGIPDLHAAARDEYLSVVWARVMRQRPPRVPLSGTAKLRFVLDAEGELLSVDIAESSGSELLDRAALNAVRRAAPFPPPPSAALPLPPFVIPFQFRPTG